jgi:hypothetical protein
MKKILAYATTLCSVLALVPSLAFAAPHAVGTNIKTSDGTVYMISSEGARRPYNSAGAFTSYGFNSWSSVVNASQEDLYLPVGTQIPPQDGKIICDTKQRPGTCYLITSGWKIGFPSEQIFKDQGFSFSNALYGDVSFLGELQNIQSGQESHRPGVLVNKDGTVYLVSSTGLVGIPNISVFNSWGYKFSDVVPANNADKALSVFGTLSMRQPGQLNPAILSIIPPLPPLPPLSTGNAKVMGTNPTGNLRYVTVGQQDAPIYSFRVYASAQKSLMVQGFDFEIKYFPDGQSADGLVSITSVKDIADSSIKTNLSTGLSGKRAQTTFNGNYIIIPAGQSKEFVVYANMNQGLSNGYLGITLKRVMNVNNDIVDGDDFINGVIQVSGGTSPIVNVAYPSVTISPYGPQSIIYTGSQVEIFSFVIKAPSSGTITIQQLGFEFGGSISPSELSNLKLYHWEPNTQVGSSSGNTLNYNSIGMVVNPPVTLSNGASAEFVLRADVNSLASGKTFQGKLTQVWTGSYSGGATPATVTGVPLLGPTLSVQSMPAPYVKKFNVTSPVDKETIQAGTTKYITWTWTGTSTISSLKITLMRKNANGGYEQQEVISSGTSNTGSFPWYVSSSLPSGKYYILVNDQTNYDAYDDSDGDFVINNPSIPENSQTVSVNADRDIKRLSDIRQLASALELYFNDYGAYPIVLGSLAPTYIAQVPVAPTPADGSCSASQNTYVYTSSNANTYALNFCLGASTQGYSAGYRTLSPQGIK